MPSTDPRSRTPPQHRPGEALDNHPSTEHPWTTSDGSPPLRIRAQVRIVTGGHAEAVAAAQGNALRDLLAALADPPADPAHHTNRDDTKGDPA
jgi:hypothetical protein